MRALVALDADAVEIGELYRKGRSSAVDSVRYCIQAGEILIAKKEEVGHGAWLLWLEANAEVLGFASPLTAQRLMKLAGNASLAMHLDEAEALQISRTLWGH